MRETIKPKLRFQVFTRDDFTCQYCGRKPDQDDVILHVDHTVSVKDGGTNDIENLITSCRDCNYGKGAKSILKRTRTEADLIEELDLAKERLEQIKALNKQKKSIKKIQENITKESMVWAIDITDGNLNEKCYIQVQKLKEKGKYTDEVLKRALEITYDRHTSNNFEKVEKFMAYLQGVANNISLTDEEQQIILLYNRDVFKYERMYPQTRKMILDYSYCGVEFHSEVVEKVNRTLTKHHGETFKLRNDVHKYYANDNFTVYKSGLGIQLLTCDSIVMLEEEYNSAFD